MLPPYCLACSLKGQNMLVMKNNLCKNEKEGVSWIYVTPFLNYLTGRQVCVRNYPGRALG